MVDSRNEVELYEIHASTTTGPATGGDCINGKFSKNGKFPLKDRDVDFVSNDKLLDENQDTPEPETKLSKCKKLIGNNWLLILTIVAIVLGFPLGIVVRQLDPSKDALMWIGLPGDLFLSMLKMMILPLVISNIISGTASVGAKSNGKMGLVSITYVVVTNVIACIIGVALSLAIKPGQSSRINSTLSVQTSGLESQDIFADLIRNLFPSNLIHACTHKLQTQYKQKTLTHLVNTSQGPLINQTIVEVDKSLGYAEGTNLLGIIVCSVLFGIATSQNKDKAKPFLLFFTSMSDLVTEILKWLLWCTPMGVLSLMVASIGAIDDLSSTFIKLGLFVCTVIVGLVIHQFGILSLIYFVVQRKNPFSFYSAQIPAWITGFVSTSGAMAIPDMIRGCEEKHHFDKRITRFTVPFVTTLNADGSALFIVSAVIFISQISGVDMNDGQIAVILFLTAVSVMALPSVPSSSIVTIIIILTTLSIPSQQVALLFTMEWLLDRLRSGCNVLSSAVSVPVVDYFIKSDFRKLDEDDKKAQMENLSFNGDVLTSVKTQI